MLTNQEISEIAARVKADQPTKGVTLSPWAKQLQKDALTLLRELEVIRIKRQKER